MKITHTMAEKGQNKILTIREIKRILKKELSEHRFDTRCGEIGYYSGAAKDFFENGKTCAVKGLN